VSTATGGSAIKAIEVLLDHGVPQERIIFLNLVSCPEGLRAMNDAYPGVKIVTAWVDEKLNEQKYIVPGLGGKSCFSLFLSLDRSSDSVGLRCPSLPDRVLTLALYVHRLRRSLLHFKLDSSTIYSLPIKSQTFSPHHARKPDILGSSSLSVALSDLYRIKGNNTPSFASFSRRRFGNSKRKQARVPVVQKAL